MGTNVLTSRKVAATLIALAATTFISAFAPAQDVGTPYGPRLADFERRRAEGTGQYLTADDLKGRGSESALWFFASTFPGLRVTSASYPFGPDILSTTRNVASIQVMSFTPGPHLYGGGIPCGVDVYLDDSPYNDSLKGIKIRNLAGAEYYPMKKAPAQYRDQTTNCAVLLLWSKT